MARHCGRGLKHCWSIYAAIVSTHTDTPKAGCWALGGGEDSLSRITSKVIQLNLTKDSCVFVLAFAMAVALILHAISYKRFSSPSCPSAPASWALRPAAIFHIFPRQVNPSTFLSTGETNWIYVSAHSDRSESKSCQRHCGASVDANARRGPIWILNRTRLLGFPLFLEMVATSWPICSMTSHTARRRHSPHKQILQMCA